MTTGPSPSDERICEMLERRARASGTDGLLEAIVSEAAVTRQASRGSLPERLTERASVFASVAAALVIVVGLVTLRPSLLGPAAPGPTSGDSPGPAATVVPSASPAIQQVVANGIDGPPLAGGRWQTSAFEPPLRFTVPDGLWTAGVDLPRQFWLRGHFPGAPAEEFDALTLVTIQNVYVDPCTDGTARSEAWGIDRQPAELLDWLETNMETELGERRPVTILGFEGLEVEFTASDFSHCAMGFMPITDNGRLSPFGTPPAGQLVRYAVLDFAGATVIVGTWTDDPARRDTVWEAADAVLDSMEIVS